MGLVLGRALGGAGDTVAPMILTALALIGIQIPLAIWLPRVFSLGIVGVWIATVIAAMILGISTAVWYGMGRWKLQRV
jgi:Na+-driven multidrug efflux pump